jgi:uncharacterized MAPEG superfamily protein
MFLPIPLALAGIPVRIRALGEFDNKHPRLQRRSLEGMPARLSSAQENSWEATILFAITVIVTHLAGLDPEVAAPWAIAFVVLRLVFVTLYLLNLDVLRSLTFVASLIVLVRMLALAA